VSANDRETRTARLAEAATGRTADATARARRAITKLRHTRQPITFVAVARTATVSTSFLYQHPELRREIKEHLSHAPDRASTPRAGSATVESLRTKLAVVVQRNRDLTEQLVVLRAENEALRSRLLDLDRGRTWPSASD
jgi:hypothetical protein